MTGHHHLIAAADRARRARLDVERTSDEVSRLRVELDTAERQWRDACEVAKNADAELLRIARGEP